jgi:orotidine-5'-phosphate decarboxylase
VSTGCSAEIDELDADAGAELLFQFCATVIDAIRGLVPAVKPQSAYFERYGAAGIRALERTIAHARAAGLLIVLDAKRGDIDATSHAYAQAYLGTGPSSPLACDCLTVSPYLGEDSLAPFLDLALENGKGVFICVKTSNPGAARLQDTAIHDGRRIYELVADLFRPWTERGLGTSGYSSIGTVVGSTYPAQARTLPRLLPRSLFLVPGYGAQGGSDEGVRACFDADARGAIVSSSRGILYQHLYGDDDSNYRAAISRAMTTFIFRVRENLRAHLGEARHLAEDFAYADRI